MTAPGQIRQTEVAFDQSVDSQGDFEENAGRSPLINVSQGLQQVCRDRRAKNSSLTLMGLEENVADRDVSTFRCLGCRFTLAAYGFRLRPLLKN